MMRWNSLILVAAAVVSSACSDDRQPFAPLSSSPRSTGSGSGSNTGILLDCVASVGASTSESNVSCAPATSSGPAAASSEQARQQVVAQDVIVGRQNVDVALAFTSVTFSGGTLSANTTIKNLLNQPLGENANGTTNPNGTRIFFVVAPAVTSGSGTVTVSNADGVSTFTTGLQPYFQYPGPIAPSATSAAKAWKFAMSAGVKGFTFSVEVDAALPAEKSIRRWVVMSQSLTTNRLSGVWARSTSDVYAVGSNTILQYDGTKWNAVGGALATANTFRAVSGVNGASVASVWAVGNNGVAVHDTAGTWSSTTTHTSNTLRGVWVVAAGNVWAVGDNATVLHFTSGAWQTITLPNSVDKSTSLRAVWGSDATHIWVVGDNGMILFTNGTTWTTQTNGSVDSRLYGVFGTAATNIFAAGDDGTVEHTANGTSWSEQTTTTSNRLRAAWVDAPTAPYTADAYAVGNNGTVQHYNGTAWLSMPTTTTSTLRGVFGTSPTNLYVVGDNGVVINGTQ